MAFLASQPEAEQMNQTLSSTQGFTVSTPENKTCDAVLVIVTLLSADAPWSGLFSLEKHSVNTQTRASRLQGPASSVRCRNVKAFQKVGAVVGCFGLLA